MKEAEITYYFNFEKTLSALDYLFDKAEGKPINYLNLVKWLYIADRNSLNKYGLLITGDYLYAMKCGPVLSRLYDLMMNRYDERFHPAEYQQFWDNHFRRDNDYNLVRIKQVSKDSLLLKKEKAILDEIYAKFKDYSYGKMIDWCHKYVEEWDEVFRSINDDRQSSPIEISRVLQKCNKKEAEIKYILEQLSHHNYVARHNLH